MNANTAERVMQYRKGKVGVSWQDRERSKEVEGCGKGAL